MRSPAKHTAAQVGESWAYRVGASDPLDEVVIIRIGVRTPARVLVRFRSEQFEGREDWVPPSRLKVAWSQAGEYLAQEQKWQAVIAASPIARTPAEHATSYVFEALIDATFATTDIRGAAGVTLIHDVPGLARVLGLTASLLTADRLAFQDAGALVVPWSITELIATTAAAANPEPVFHHAQACEAGYHHKTMRGEFHESGGQDRGVYIPAEWFVRERDAAHNAPYWRLLRSWAGHKAALHFDDLAELRTELARTTTIAHEAIAALRDQGSARQANQLAKKLHTPRPSTSARETAHEHLRQPEVRR